MLREFMSGALVAATAVTVLAGCGTGSSDNVTFEPATPTTSAAPVDGTKDLAAAVAATAATTFELTLDTGDNEEVTGAFDGGKRVGSLESTTDGEQMKIVTTPTRLYLSGLDDFNGKIIRVRIAKLKEKNPFAFFADPAVALTLLTSATDVKQTSPGAFSGSLDLSKVTVASTASKKAVAWLLAYGGSQASEIAFTASVKDGYLTEFKTVFPGIDEGKDGEYAVVLSGFGTPVKVKEPTGRDVVEAPAELYAAT